MNKIVQHVEVNEVGEDGLVEEYGLVLRGRRSQRITLYKLKKVVVTKDGKGLAADAIVDLD